MYWDSPDRKPEPETTLRDSVSVIPPQKPTSTNEKRELSSRSKRALALQKYNSNHNQKRRLYSVSMISVSEFKPT